MSLVLCNIRFFFFWFGTSLHLSDYCFKTGKASLNFDINTNSVALMRMRFHIFFSGIHFAPSPAMASATLPAFKV